MSFKMSINKIFRYNNGCFEQNHRCQISNIKQNDDQIQNQIGKNIRKNNNRDNIPGSVPDQIHKHCLYHHGKDTCCKNDHLFSLALYTEINKYGGSKSYTSDNHNQEQS